MAHVKQRRDAVREVFTGNIFTLAELRVLAEFLRIAQSELVTNADALELRHPLSQVLPTLRGYASQAADFRERIAEVTGA